MKYEITSVYYLNYDTVYFLLKLFMQCDTNLTGETYYLQQMVKRHQIYIFKDLLLILQIIFSKFSLLKVNMSAIDANFCIPCSLSSVSFTQSKVIFNVHLFLSLLYVTKI